MLETLRILAIPLLVAGVRSCPTQSVTATAESVTTMCAKALATDSIPSGTDLTGGVVLSTSGTLGSAFGSYGVSTSGSQILYRSDEVCFAWQGQGQGAGTANVGDHAAMLTLSSSQPVAGTVTVDLLSVLSSPPTTFASGMVSIDIGDDGTVEFAWDTAAAPTAIASFPVVVSGDLDIRVRSFLGAFTFGSGSASVDVDFGVTFEPRAACVARNGTGANPSACTCATLPVLGSSWEVAIAPGANTVQTFAFASTVPIVGVALPFGEALIGGSVLAIPGNGIHPVSLPNLIGLIGFPISVQGVRFDVVGGALQVALTDAQDATLGT